MGRKGGVPQEGGVMDGYRCVTPDRQEWRVWKSVLAEAYECIRKGWRREGNGL